MSHRSVIPIEIRRAFPGDAGAIAELSRQLGYPATREEIAARVEALAASSLDAVFVAARGAGERVIGWLHVFGRTMIESAPYAEIGGLVVDESERGRGVGRALVAQAESWASEHGYKTIRVRSNVVREDAHRFYAARSYRMTKQQGVFVKDLS